MVTKNNTDELINIICSEKSAEDKFDAIVIKGLPLEISNKICIQICRRVIETLKSVSQETCLLGENVIEILELYEKKKIYKENSAAKLLKRIHYDIENSSFHYEKIRTFKFALENFLNSEGLPLTPPYDNALRDCAWNAAKIWDTEDTKIPSYYLNEYEINFTYLLELVCEYYKLNMKTLMVLYG